MNFISRAILKLKPRLEFEHTTNACKRLHEQIQWPLANSNLPIKHIMSEMNKPFRNISWLDVHFWLYLCNNKKINFVIM